LIHELTVIAPLDSRLSILNPVNHFSTHLRPAKANPMIIPLPWTLCSMSIFSCLITMIIISYPCTISLWSCGDHSLPHTPSSHVLLMPNSIHLTHVISNLVSLITKTKLGLSTSKPVCDGTPPTHGGARLLLWWRWPAIGKTTTVDSRRIQGHHCNKFCF
jgi:hypothetical protein